MLNLPLSTVALGAHRLIPSGYSAAGGHAPLALRLLASFITGEIGFYWGHRCSHEISTLWSLHALHHSAEHIDFLVNTKAMH